MSKFSILVICYANYCRSPVGEKLLQDKYGNDVNVLSRGLIQYNSSSMDKRSSEYLEMKGLSNTTHIPKKVKKIDFDQADIVLTFDANLILSLANLDRSLMQKVKLFTYADNNEMIEDPYKFKDKKHYFKQMDKIFYAARKFDISFLKNLL